MTSCEKYQAVTVALFDNETRDEDLRLVAGHLHDCPACRTFCLDLMAIRRTLTSASVTSLSPAARQQVLTSVKADRAAGQESREGGSAPALSFTRLGRWAAVLLIGVLSITCFTLNRTADDLRGRLTVAKEEVTAIRKQEELAEAEERQRKAISALYFRMAELEERVDRFSPSRRIAFPTQTGDHPEGQGNL